jgi:cell division septum initiation protein DivIVA
MPKKDKKAAKKDKGRDPADVVEAVRGAVERTFQATTGGTEGARDRGRSLLDDVASAAQRIRESFDDLRVLEDVRGLRAEIEALSRRVAELEKQVAKPAAAAPAKTTPARRAPAKRATTAKAPAKAPAKPSAASTAAKTTGPKAKPAATRGKSAASSSSSSTSS